MSIRLLALAAALACVPALHAQDLALQPGVLVPSVDTLYNVSAGGGGDTVAVSIQTLRPVTMDGEELWAVEYLFRGAGGSMGDTTWLHPATLLPREQRRTGIVRDLRVRFDGTRAHLRRGPSTRGEPADTVEVAAEQPVFAGSLMDLVYRALPLEEGFRTRVPFLIPERAQVWWFHVHVSGAAAVQTREGPVQAWRVEAGLEGAEPEVFWIARDTRLLLRVDHGDGSASIR